MEKNKTGQYVKYAIGEILLVVIGILIALQINNWNEERKEYRKSKALLEEFRKDLVRDTVESTYVTGKLETRIKIEAWALRQTAYKPSDIDSLKMIYFSTYYQLPMTTRTFDKLQNSENPDLTGFEELQNQLTKYYTYTKYLLDAMNEEEKFFALESEINHIIREKGEMDLEGFPLLPQAKDGAELIAFAQSIEGRNYIKVNYKQRNSMLRYFNRVKQEAQELILALDNSLKASN